MKKIVAPLLIVLSIWCLIFNSKIIEAKTPIITPTETIIPTVTIEPTVIPVVNITEAKSNKIDYEVEKWNCFNSFKWMIKLAIERGVSTNTIVLLLQSVMSVCKSSNTLNFGVSNKLSLASSFKLSTGTHSSSLYVVG